MNTVSSILIDLHISPDEYKKLYAGVAQNVNARARDGRRIQFPASSLRPYLRPSGITGTFQILIDENNKLIQINRLG